MNITVHFIGRYKQVIGESQQRITLNKGDTISDVVEHLAQRFPQLSKDKKFLMVSKNNSFTTLEDTLHEDDTITIIPPVVAGG